MHPNPYSVSDSFTAPDGTRLFFELNDQGSRGAVTIVPGWMETTTKYAELAGELIARGHPVFVFDPRSQGRSSRLADNPEVTHIDRFDDYVTDLAAFYEQVVGPRGLGRSVLLGHSMGGLIGAWFAVRQPGRVNGLVLSAPLFEVHGGWMPEPLVYWTARVLAALGRGRDYVPGHGDWRAEEWNFEGNRLTHSEARFRRWREILAGDPAVRVGGVSCNWLKCIIEAARAVEDLAADIEVPVLLMQAGLDRLVKPGRQERFHRRAPDCRFERFPDARHELLMEADPIRDRVVARIFGFLDEVLT